MVSTVSFPFLRGKANKQIYLKLIFSRKYGPHGLRKAGLMLTRCGATVSDLLTVSTQEHSVYVAVITINIVKCKFPGDFRT